MGIDNCSGTAWFVKDIFILFDNKLCLHQMLIHIKFQKLTIQIILNALKYPFYNLLLWILTILIYFLLMNVFENLICRMYLFALGLEEFEEKIDRIAETNGEDDPNSWISNIFNQFAGQYGEVSFLIQK